MFSLVRVALFFVLVVWMAMSAAAAPNQFEARYVSVGVPGAASGSADLLAVDSSGAGVLAGTPA